MCIWQHFTLLCGRGILWQKLSCSILPTKVTSSNPGVDKIYCFYKQSFIGTQSHRFVSSWAVASFMQQNWIIGTETLWPTHLKCSLLGIPRDSFLASAPISFGRGPKTHLYGKKLREVLYSRNLLMLLNLASTSVLSSSWNGPHDSHLLAFMPLCNRFPWV